MRLSTTGETKIMVAKIFLTANWAVQRSKIHPYCACVSIHLRANYEMRKKTVEWTRNPWALQQTTILWSLCGGVLWQIVLLCFFWFRVVLTSRVVLNSRLLLFAHWLFQSCPQVAPKSLLAAFWATLSILILIVKDQSTGFIVWYPSGLVVYHLQRAINTYRVLHALRAMITYDILLLKSISASFNHSTSCSLQVINATFNLDELGSATRVLNVPEEGKIS